MKLGKIDMGILVLEKIPYSYVVAYTAVQLALTATLTTQSIK